MPKICDDIVHIVVKVEILLRAGRAEEAAQVVQNAIARLGEEPELCFCAANTTASNKVIAKCD